MLAVDSEDLKRFACAEVALLRWRGQGHEPCSGLGSCSRAARRGLRVTPAVGKEHPCSALEAESRAPPHPRGPARACAWRDRPTLLRLSGSRIAMHEYSRRAHFAPQRPAPLRALARAAARQKTKTARAAAQGHPLSAPPGHLLSAAHPPPALVEVPVADLVERLVDPLDYLPHLLLHPAHLPSPRVSLRPPRWSCVVWQRTYLVCLQLAELLGVAAKRVHLRRDVPSAAGAAVRWLGQARGSGSHAPRSLELRRQSLSHKDKPRVPRIPAACSVGRNAKSMGNSTVLLAVGCAWLERLECGTELHGTFALDVQCDCTGAQRTELSGLLASGSDAACVRSKVHCYL